MAFEQIVEIMAEMGVFQLFFPWLLVLAITFGVLEKYNIFSEDAQVNGTIALAVAFISIGGAYFFIPQGLMTSFAAALTFSIFGILGLMILLGVAGYDLSDAMDESSLPVGGAIILGILSFIGAFVFQADLGGLLGGVENTFQEAVMPILILVFLLLVVATVGGSSD